MAKEDTDNAVTELMASGSNDDTDSSTLIEITTYIRPHQAFALEILENAERQRLGKDFDRATLIQEALDLLIKKHLAVVDLRKDKLVKKDS